MKRKLVNLLREKLILEISLMKKLTTHPGSRLVTGQHLRYHRIVGFLHPRQVTHEDFPHQLKELCLLEPTLKISRQPLHPRRGHLDQHSRNLWTLQGRKAKEGRRHYPLLHPEDLRSLCVLKHHHLNRLQ
jgi:hypothetical protein